MKLFNAKIYSGKVFHLRTSVKVHQFTYPTIFIKFSLLNIDKYKNIFFSINRFNLFSFNFIDHGYRDGSSLITFAKDKLKKENIDPEFEDIVIQTYPRILGYVFNPVSFWEFYKNGQVYARLAEVNNTFGETNTYVITGLDQNYMKTLHVSPFNQIEGHYRFSFSNSENQVKSSIEYFVNSKVLLFASITGKAKEFTSLNLFFTFLIYPIHNLAAIFFIHYEALFLYLKKIPFHGKQGVKHDHTT